MILRRFMQHIKEQNWFAVGLDVIVVIVGIFLGMQVTDWNDTRKVRTQESYLLDNLESDLVASINLLKSTEASAIDNIKNANQIYDAIPDAEKLKSLTADWSTFVIRSMSASAPQVQLATLTQLVSGGHLQYIQNPDLQRTIIQLHEYVKTRKNWTQVTLETGLYSFLDLNDRVERRYPLDNLAEPTKWISVGRIMSGPDEMASDPKIKKLYQRQLHVQTLLLDLMRQLRIEIGQTLNEIQTYRQGSKK